MSLDQGLVLGVLIVIIGFQAIWINLLFNKLMSRNYYDYEMTKHLTKPEEKKSDKIEVGPVEENYDDPTYILGDRT